MKRAIAEKGPALLEFPTLLSRCGALSGSCLPLSSFLYFLQQHWRLKKRIGVVRWTGP